MKIERTGDFDSFEEGKIKTLNFILVFQTITVNHFQTRQNIQVQQLKNFAIFEHSLLAIHKLSTAF